LGGSILPLIIAVLGNHPRVVYRCQDRQPSNSNGWRIQEIANGHIAIKQVEITSQDEVGQLGTAFNTMSTNLWNLVRQVSQSAGLVPASSEELKASVEQSSQATNIV